MEMIEVVHSENEYDNSYQRPKSVKMLWAIRLMLHNGTWNISFFKHSSHIVNSMRYAIN